MLGTSGCSRAICRIAYPQLACCAVLRIGSALVLPADSTAENLEPCKHIPEVTLSYRLLRLVPLHDLMILTTVMKLLWS